MSKGKLAVRIVAGMALAGLVYLSLVITPFGHRSVIWSVGGVSYDEREPGLSFVVPLFQRYHLVAVREQRLLTVNEKGEANAVVHTDDLQEVFIRASLIWRINPDKAAEVLNTIGGVDQVLPIIEADFRDAIKEIGGLQQALDLASSLGPMATAVEDLAIAKLAPRGIDVIVVDLEDAVFDELFLASIRDKVIADQEAAEQQRLVAAEAAKLEQVELQAQAQRQRANKLGLSPAQYLELLWLDKWNGQLPATVVGEGSDVLVNVP